MRSPQDASPHAYSGWTAAIEREIDHGAQEDGCRKRMFLRQSFGRRRHQLIEIAIQFRLPPHHEFRCLGGCRPIQEKCKRLVDLRESLGISECLLLCLQIIEVRQSLEEGAEMLIVQRLLEARPSIGLGFLSPPQGLERLDARELPFEWHAGPACRIDLIQHLKCFLRPAGRDQAIGDVGRNHRHLARFLGLLSDVGINIALGVGNFLQGYAHRQISLSAVDLISVKGPRAAPADDLALIISRIVFRLFGPLNEERFQAIETILAEGRHHRRNQVVVLAVTIVLHGFKHLVGQDIGVDPGGGGDCGSILASLMKTLDDRTAALVGSFKDRIRQCEELPYQFESLLGIIGGKPSL